MQLTRRIEISGAAALYGLESHILTDGDMSRIGVSRDGEHWVTVDVPTAMLDGVDHGEALEWVRSASALLSADDYGTEGAEATR